MREARCLFNPCLYHDVIYLCGSGSQIMEAFSPRSGAFLPLNISVPENHYCCVYVNDDKLVVHSYSYILKYSLSQANQLAEVSRTQAPALDKWQNSQPIVNTAQKLVYIGQNESIVVFNMDTGAKV